MLNYFKTIPQTFRKKNLVGIGRFGTSINQSIKPKMVPIQTLTQLIESKEKMQNPKFDKDNYDPCELYIGVIRSLKLSLYQIPEYSDKIIKVMSIYKDDMAYLKHFVKILVPTDQMWPDINNFYIGLAISYLRQQGKFQKQQLFYMLQNLERILKKNRSEWMDQNWVQKDYTQQQQLANLLVPRLVEKQKLFDTTFFMRLVKICDMLQINSPDLAEFLVRNIGSNKIRVKMTEIIDVLAYLSRFYRLPYEYFYENKKKWIHTIQSYNKFSTKKSIESIKMFQLLVSENPMHCQMMFKKLQDILLQAIPSFDHEQLANIWQAINRAKFGIDERLTKKVIQKIGELVSGMETRQLCLIVRGFTNFKYIPEYRHECQYILKEIQKKMTSQRVYEHEIINFILQSLKDEGNSTLKIQ